MEKPQLALANRDLDLGDVLLEIHKQPSVIAGADS